MKILNSTHVWKIIPVPYDRITRTGIVGKYQRMADAIKQVAKETRKLPIVFSLCEWGWVRQLSL